MWMRPAQSVRQIRGVCKACSLPALLARPRTAGRDGVNPARAPAARATILATAWESAYFVLP
eukprot:1431827-Rhodomonas_salina.1